MDRHKKKELYRSSCSKHPGISIFAQEWWLDAVCGRDTWDVAIIVKNNEIVAAMPYMIVNKWGLSYITMPLLTQKLGPWVQRSEAGDIKTIADQKKLMQDLINQLPAFDYFSQNWSYQFTNWLPFKWRGFSQTTYYTYIFQNLEDVKSLWAGMSGSIRREIRKADNRFNLTIRDDLQIDDFLRLNRLTFSRQGKTPTYSNAFVRRLHTACEQKKCCKFWIAEDSQGRHHAGVYIVWDNESAYYLMGGGDPGLRGSGAGSLCMWHAIQYAREVTKQFDFEGSMIESVEKYFRAFGAKQVPYFSISKTPSRLLRFGQALKLTVRQPCN